MSDPQGTELSGKTLADRYKVETPLSQGAMGAVFIARDQRTGGEVAVKQLIDPAQARRFEIEGRLLARLDHERVVKVLDHFAQGRDRFLVMELIEGPSLLEVLQDHGQPGIDLDEVLMFTRNACEALEYVHGQQVVHRDVKPSNLILSAEGVVLVDFGIARVVSADGATTAIGTPGFMAPEVMIAGNASARSDVYGIAATLWTLLGGKPPPFGHQEELVAQLPRSAKPIREPLFQALQPMPEDRQASAATFAEELGQPLAEVGGRGVELSAPGPEPKREVLESIARTAAGLFDAAATSIALVDSAGGLVYQAAWGAGAEEIVGVTLGPGEGIAGAVAQSARAEVISDCRGDSRFAAGIAAGTGYVPHTMLVIPLEENGLVRGVLTVLDRRDGELYGAEDLARATLFADLALVALE
ncbi:MAG: protein kinase [Thermoleophilaceae bacterium]|nr:protein kinase [Thermoleophilaceae bacterium]